jgi:hypothetical protein
MLPTYALKRAQRVPRPGTGKLVGSRHEMRNAPLGLFGVQLLLFERLVCRLTVLISVVPGMILRRVGHASPFLASRNRTGLDPGKLPSGSDRARTLGGYTHRPSREAASLDGSRAHTECRHHRLANGQDYRERRSSGLRRGQEDEPKEAVFARLHGDDPADASATPRFKELTAA